jgi:hypothetical protein
MRILASVNSSVMAKERVFYCIMFFRGECFDVAIHDWDTLKLLLVVIRQSRLMLVLRL